MLFRSSLAHLDAARAAHGFVEFRPYLGRCRFRDCVHRNEPGCALREAAEAHRLIQGGHNRGKIVLKVADL